MSIKKVEKKKKKKKTSAIEREREKMIGD